jgi:hypothetical protein
LSLLVDAKYPASRFAAENKDTTHLTRANWRYEDLQGKHTILGEMDWINTR